MFIHDLIKIKYIREGYLSNYPYHMISDEEMFNAFLNPDYISSLDLKESQYFYYAYPMIDDAASEVKKAWISLRKSILYHIQMYKYQNQLLKCDSCDEYLWMSNSIKRKRCPNCGQSLSIAQYKIPDWVYSYMLGTVIGPKSSVIDIHDIILPMNADNIDDEFGAEQAHACYEVSKNWINKIGAAKIYTITEEDVNRLHLPTVLFSTVDAISLRPITIYGEPHVIKSIRLSQVSPIKGG